MIAFPYFAALIKSHLFFLLLTENYPKYFSDNRSCEAQLPEECHWEIEYCCLEPHSNHLISCILKKQCCSKAHQRHIPMMDKTEIASTIINGLSFCGFTIVNAFFFAIGPTRKKSRMKAIGPMMISSWNAARKTHYSFRPYSGRCCSRSLHKP